MTASSTKLSMRHGNTVTRSQTSEAPPLHAALETLADTAKLNSCAMGRQCTEYLRLCDHVHILPGYEMDRVEGCACSILVKEIRREGARRLTNWDVRVGCDGELLHDVLRGDIRPAEMALHCLRRRPIWPIARADLHGVIF